MPSNPASDDEREDAALVLANMKPVSNPASGTNEPRRSRLHGWTRNALLEAGFSIPLLRDDPRVEALAVAIERALATERAIGAALDVTRLRKALVSLDRILDGQRPMAAQIAAEYQRLASETPRPGEPPHNHDGGAHCFSGCPAYRELTP